MMWPITRFLAPEVGGGGVGTVLYALKRKSGFIRARVIPLKIIATSFVIGARGSAGPEGPVVQIGASVGSFISQIFKFPAEKTKLFVACGTAAGIAATFNAPMAGVFFALEILLGSFRTQSFGLVAVSSASGALVARIIMGDAPVFSIPIQYNIAQYHELWVFLAMGIGCALVGRGFTKMLLSAENLGERIKIPSWIKLGVGGLLVGIIGLKFPGAIGIGYEHGTDVIRQCLDGSTAIQLLLIILVLKMMATSITLGSGGSGGTLAPILVLGALTGAIFGELAEQFFPGDTAPIGAYAVVAMGGMFGAVALAPITGIFIIFEMTNNSHLLIPLMVTTVVGYLVATGISRTNIFSDKLVAQGIIPPGEAHDPLAGLCIQDAMALTTKTLQQNANLKEANEFMDRYPQRGYLILDEENRLVGTVSVDDINQALALQLPEELTLVRDIMQPVKSFGYPEDALNQGLLKMHEQNLDVLPVVSSIDPQKFIGILTHREILNAYHRYSMK